MDENLTKEEHTKQTTKEYPMCANHPLMKTLFIGFLIFTGAYCAFYTVADWYMKNFIAPQPFPPRMEKMFKNDMREMDRMFKNERFIPQKSAGVIHLEQSKDAYKVLIDLRAFDNNENNVQVLTNGNLLTINGRTIKKSKHNEQISEFQQNYMFGNNVKLKELTKSTNGNYYTITIPIDNEEE